MRADRGGAHAGRKKEGDEMIYLQLFLSFLQIGLFSFGGGYGGDAADTGTGGDRARPGFPCRSLRI